MSEMTRRAALAAVAAVAAAPFLPANPVGSTPRREYARFLGQFGTLTAYNSAHEIVPIEAIDREDVAYFITTQYVPIEEYRKRFRAPGDLLAVESYHWSQR